MSGDTKAQVAMAAALRPFGWECGPTFWQQYYSDPWVFHLANAVESQAAEIERLKALIKNDRGPEI